MARGPVRAGMQVSACARTWSWALACTLFLGGCGAGHRAAPERVGVPVAVGVAGPATRPAARQGGAPGARPGRRTTGTAADASPAPRAPDPGRRIPVLMYHVIARPAPGAPWPSLYVARSLFAAQVHALAAAGYQAITLAEALAIWTGRAPGPPHPVVLSFDDGYTSVYRNALPILRGMQWPGVLCQQVQRIGFRGGFSAAQIRAMLHAGWELADHAITQPELDLTTATPTVIHREVFTSRAELRRRFGQRVRFFCYPVGHYNPAVVAAVRAAGFAGALSTVFGPADPAVEGMDRLERLRVWAGESPAQLLAIVHHAATVAPPPPPRSFPSPPRAAPARQAPRRAG